MTKILRRLSISFPIIFCTLFAFNSMAAFPQKALAQSYPTKPIRIVCHNSAGSSPDIIARQLGTFLMKELGQPVVVDNRPGGEGTIAADAVVRAAPDGYTFVTCTSTLVVSAALGKLKYDLLKDFAPVSMLNASPHLLVAKPSLPVNSVKELVAFAKPRPGQVRYSNTGALGPTNLFGAIFGKRVGVDLFQIPYKGTTPALIAVMSGEADITIAALPACLSMVKNKQLKALAIMSAKRSAEIPDVPSISEFAAGCEFIGFGGLLAPAKTPQGILSKLNSAISKAMKTPQMREQIAKIGSEAIGSSQEELASHISSEIARWKEAIKLLERAPGPKG